MRTYTADEVDAMIGRALARERERVAQQEPVAKVYRHGRSSNGAPWHEVHWFDEGVNMPDGTLLYTTPQAQPAQRQEPYGWHTEDHLTDRSATTYSKDVADRWKSKGWPVTPFYTSPPAHRQARSADTWVGLTFEEVREIFQKMFDVQADWPDFADAIEAKLKEKNT